MTASPTVAASPITDQNAGLDIPNLLQRNMLASIAGTATGSVVDHAWSTADYIMRSILGHLNAGGAEDDWTRIPRTFREHTNTITEADQALYTMLELSDSGAIIHPSLAHHVTMYRSQLLRKSCFRMIA